MPDALNPWVTYFTTDVALPLATETEIARVQCIGLRAGQKVFVEGWVDEGGAVGATTCLLRIRRGAGLAGAVVGESPALVAEVTAAGQRSMSSQAVDNAPNDDPFYTLTGQAAGAAQSVLNGSLKVTVAN